MYTIEYRGLHAISILSLSRKFKLMLLSILNASFFFMQHKFKTKKNIFSTSLRTSSCIGRIYKSFLKENKVLLKDFSHIKL